MKARLVTRISLVRSRSDQGDVPGWVMVTVMSAALVVAILGVATPQLTASSPMPSHLSPGNDSGSAVVETVLVTVLLLGLSLGIVQLALVGHVRSVLSEVAAEGAREGGRADATPDEGAAYAQQAARDSLGMNVTCTGAVEIDGASQLLTVVVRCHGGLSTTALPVGTVQVSAEGRALREQP